MSKPATAVEPAARPVDAVSPAARGGWPGGVAGLLEMPGGFSVKPFVPNAAQQEPRRTMAIATATDSDLWIASNGPRRSSPLGQIDAVVPVCSEVD